MSTTNGLVHPRPRASRVARRVPLVLLGIAPLTSVIVFFMGLDSFAVGLRPGGVTSTVGPLVVSRRENRYRTPDVHSSGWLCKDLLFKANLRI